MIDQRGKRARRNRLNIKTHTIVGLSVERVSLAVLSLNAPRPPRREVVGADRRPRPTGAKVKIDLLIHAREGRGVNQVLPIHVIKVSRRRAVPGPVNGRRGRRHLRDVASRRITAPRERVMRHDPVII